MRLARCSSRPFFRIYAPTCCLPPPHAPPPRRTQIDAAPQATIFRATPPRQPDAQRKHEQNHGIFSPPMDFRCRPPSCGLRDQSFQRYAAGKTGARTVRCKIRALSDFTNIEAQAQCHDVAPPRDDHAAVAPQTAAERRYLPVSAPF